MVWTKSCRIRWGVFSLNAVPRTKPVRISAFFRDKFTWPALKQVRINIGVGVRLQDPEAIIQTYLQ